MSKKITLGKKIVLGFTSLIVITLVLGGISIYSMQQVRQATIVLAEQNIPEMVGANDIERATRQAMFEMRGYAYTDDPDFLAATRKGLAGVGEAFQKATSHAQSFNMADALASLGSANSDAQTYSKLVDETEKLNADLIGNRNNMGATAEKFTKECVELAQEQEKAFTEELTAALSGKGQGAASLESLTKKMTIILLAKDSIAATFRIRQGVWKGIATRDINLITDSVKGYDNVIGDLEEMQRQTSVAKDLERIGIVQTAAREYQNGAKQFAELWNKRDVMVQDRNKAGNAVLTAVQALADSGSKATTASASKAQQTLGRASTLLLVGLLSAAALGIVLAFVITRSITRPIRRIIDALTTGADQTAAASAQVSQSSQSMAEGATEQASSLEETSASLEEMTSMTKQNAENASQARSLAASSNTSAEKGVQAMDRMSKAIDDIKRSSDETAKIVKTIDEIAFQTNLLALNAAVEAARAGDAGKGFAVVAEEVRNLAQRSAEAARKTAAMIEDSVKNASNGVEISREVGEALQEIGGTTQKVNSLVSEIALASNEQAQGIGQLNQAVQQMDAVTQQNAASTEESAAAAEELNAQADEMSRMVGQLQEMVGGATSGQTRPAALAVEPAAIGKRKTLTARSQASAKALTVQATVERRVASPANVIPLDEDDMKDF
ncbi:MAG: MCP four helix bundle domain-containing protein [Candidatus Hydrogenedentes bacterium]|nr:MCP four helix bundle domain-containing protein [Candidatus Hydrogenedentota bacterium]